MADQQTDIPEQENERIDRFGAIASSLCAIHCAICALLPAALGTFGLGMLLTQEVEWLFTIFAISFALAALIVVLRQSRSYAIVGLLGLGIIGLLTSRGLEMGSDHHHGEGHHAEHKDENHSSAHSNTHHAENNEKKSGHADEHDGHTEDHADHAGEQNDHKDEHTDEAEHSDSMHLLGASIGVAGGFLLFFGHLLNIRAIRKESQKDNHSET